MLRSKILFAMSTDYFVDTNTYKVKFVRFSSTPDTLHSLLCSELFMIQDVSNINSEQVFHIKNN